jgi:hypothetical protein
MTPRIVRLPLRDARALPEYSCSVPTGFVVGKQWRALTLCGWVHCEYSLRGSTPMMRASYLLTLPAAEEARLYGPVAPPRRRPRRITKKLASRAGRLRYPDKTARPLPTWT